MMESSVKAAEVLVPPQPNKSSSALEPQSSEAVEVAAAASSDVFDPMKEFSRRLEDIIRTYGSASSLLDKQGVVEADVEKIKEEAKGDITVAMDTEVSLIMQSLSKLSSPEEKLDDLVKKYAELAAMRRCDAQKLCALQQKMSILLEERQQLQAERRSGVAARGELESLCRDLQSHYNMLREETLQRCREDEEKRREITSHFQDMLNEIQIQIEQHSTRNDKLCHENSSLTDKLESLMSQCEKREESLEKINKHRDLQNKLTEAKLQQANALLAEAEEKHKREKEYLLVQAAEWKLQSQSYREQGTVMQAQLALYAQKFDEFQATLAKSNEIYVRFKKEMDNMSDKMKKMEKESNLWKTRFENCNKALTDMIQERTEKSKEYDLFVLKIQKLEKLCRALQEERKILYDKIKDVRRSNTEIPFKVFGSSKVDTNPEPKDAGQPALLTSEEVLEIEEKDPVLTEDMARLKEEQAKLQEFAASLLATPNDHEEEESKEEDPEEDMVASAFVHFKTKTQVKEDLVPVPELVEEVKVEQVQNTDVLTSEAPTPEEKTTPQLEEAKVQTQAGEVGEVQQVKPDEKIEPVVSAPEILEEVPVEKESEKQHPAEQEPSGSAPPSDSTPKTDASSDADSKKQAPKKKKKRNSKSES
ncbi:beta-taxilin isoform X2 [Mugil cephalus]|uniref:beta-taxilin isoform X2 n=1 Tax=Mugil cephalus TaxID=48193 RepID=UPI001FB821EB|nr:beta-taxilin isoform X2 [Mugil cephalus]